MRQLKNITEQMSILSKEREITGEALSQFIPQDMETTQLVTIGGGNASGQHSYESERDLLYKILYELRGNVSDLRREVGDLRKQLDEARGTNTVKQSLNLENISRHMLEKALEKNGGNRKKAAQELGISDRTLYRRIKQYGLDK